MSARDVYELAETYHLSALHMADAAWANKPRSSAPFRLVAIHAIELYLNAYLLCAGVDAATVRGLQHDLSKRVAIVIEAGVVLPRKTAEHLQELSLRREYLVSRYGNQDTNSVSQTNQVKSTLSRVRKVVTREIEKAASVVGVATRSNHSHSIVPGGLDVTS